jgi:hypothetical protein
VNDSDVIYGPEMVIPRGAFDDDGRLSPDDLLAKLHESGIIQELKRRKLWIGEETTQRPARGIGFDDFAELYSEKFSPKTVAAEKKLLGSSKELRKSANAMREAVAAYRWALALGAVSSFDYEEYFVILRRRDGKGSDIVATEASSIAEDVLEHLENSARNLESLAKRFAVPGNRSNIHRALFCERWTALARSRCNTPIDGIGSRFSEIVFGTQIEEESFQRSRKRLAAKRRKGTRAGRVRTE